MGFPSKVLSGFRSLSISGKSTLPPTPPDSTPPTPGSAIPYATELPAPPSLYVSAGPGQPVGSKRWTRSFTANQKSIPRPVASPLQRNSPTSTPIAAETTAVAAQPAPLIDPSGHQNLLQILQFIDAKFSGFFEDAGLESADRAVKDQRDLVTLRKIYQWQQGGATKPPYPPCLLSIPKDEQIGLLQIFDFTRLVDTVLASVPSKSIPPHISRYIYGDQDAKTIAGLVADFAKLTARHKNIGTEPSVANRADWFTDAVFGQQSFTGCNPTSIKRASPTWIKEFADTAKGQGNELSYKLLTTSEIESFYIQDYSYFRTAVGAFPGAALQSDDNERFACAAVTIYQLGKNAKLHPIAICIDYIQSLEHSVVIFNKRLRSTDPTKGERDDWPWRYAKTCHQLSDWTHHELGVHLNDCHLIEEATCVAACRSFTSDHIVYRLLEPHWLKTLSLNASARSTLVPGIVTRVVGVPEAAVYNLILYYYKQFHFTDNYIPNQLASRGFAPSSINEQKFHNYAWARNMIPMWLVLQKFVSSVLTSHYSSDAAVASDDSIRSWCNEMHSPHGAQMTSFPEIKTIEDLTNAVVMCIHIASPQHNSVNYLQCYYNAFIPAKPPCFSTPLPQTIEELKAYREPDLMAALPVNDEKVSLLAEQLPYLLSYGVSSDQTLLAYAEELEGSAKDSGEKELAKAAKGLYDDLLRLGEGFEKNSNDMDDTIVAYNVMDPVRLAVSILL